MTLIHDPHKWREGEGEGERGSVELCVFMSVCLSVWLYVMEWIAQRTTGVTPV